MGTGHCLPNSRVAFQPLGFDSLALLGHSTALKGLDNPFYRLMIIIVRQTVFGIDRAPSQPRGFCIRGATPRTVRG